MVVYVVKMFGEDFAYIEKKEEDVDGTSLKISSDSNGKDNDHDEIKEEAVTTSTDCNSSEGISNMTTSTITSCINKRKLNEIIICAYTDHECNTLMELCDDIFKFQKSPS